MDAIASIPLIGGPIATVLPFIVVLGIVVFVHEFGHYIVARLCGIRSEVFSIGFGPVLWSHRDSRGTLWQVAALPLGGYVRFLGDSDGASRADRKSLERLPASERAHSFHGASVGRRMLTVLAGPFFNFLLTIVVFAVAFRLGASALTVRWAAVTSAPSPTYASVLPPMRASVTMTDTLMIAPEPPPFSA